MEGEGVGGVRVVGEVARKGEGGRATGVEWVVRCRSGGRSPGDLRERRDVVEGSLRRATSGPRPLRVEMGRSRARKVSRRLWLARRAYKQDALLRMPSLMSSSGAGRALSCVSSVSYGRGGSRRVAVSARPEAERLAKGIHLEQQLEKENSRPAELA